MDTIERTRIGFSSGGVECAAWHYEGTNAGCVVMASGTGVTKEPGTDLFAARFQRAGFSVLAFDFRHWGESGGMPRHVLRVREQLADWEAAIRCAKSLPEVESTKVAAWSFSATGGLIFRVAATGTIAAGIAQTPMVDSFAAGPNALRHETPRVVLSFPFIAFADAMRGWLGRTPLMVPLHGPRGTIAMITTPDAQDSGRALNPGGRYPEWDQRIAARSAMRMFAFRPGRVATKVNAPLLVVVAEQDQSALAKPAVRAAAKAPRATVVRVPGGHYAPFLDQHDVVVDAEISFLRNQLKV